MNWLTAQRELELPCCKRFFRCLGYSVSWFGCCHGSGRISRWCWFPCILLIPQSSTSRSSSLYSKSWQRSWLVVSTLLDQLRYKARQMGTAFGSWRHAELAWRLKRYSNCQNLEDLKYFSNLREHDGYTNGLVGSAVGRQNPSAPQV